MPHRLCWLLASGIRIPLASSQHNLYDTNLLLCVQYKIFICPEERGSSFLENIGTTLQTYKTSQKTLTFIITSIDTAGTVLNKLSGFTHVSIFWQNASDIAGSSSIPRLKNFRNLHRKLGDQTHVQPKCLAYIQGKLTQIRTMKLNVVQIVPTHKQ